MAKRALDNPKIDVIWNAVVVEILGEGEVTGVTLEDTVTGERRQLETDGVFVAIGHEPNTSIFAGQLELDDKGYVVLAGGTAPPRPRSRGCSPPETSPIRCTARPSRPPAPGAPPPSTPALAGRTSDA
jgi:hypothetical protein